VGSARRFLENQKEQISHGRGSLLVATGPASGSALGVNAMTLFYLAIFLLLFALVSTVLRFRRHSGRKGRAGMRVENKHFKKTAA
jgi:hypothetical protein